MQSIPAALALSLASALLFMSLAMPDADSLPVRLGPTECLAYVRLNLSLGTPEAFGDLAAGDPCGWLLSGDAENIAGR